MKTRLSISVWVALWAMVGLIALTHPAPAQWQVPSGSIPLGKGQGKVGFGFITPGGGGTQCLLDTAPPTFGACGASSLPSLANGRVWIGNGSNVATPVIMSGDCTIVAAGAITCTKTSGVTFGTGATTNVGTIATQDSNNISVTGGSLAGVTLTTSAFNGTVGATTPSTGRFTGVGIGVASSSFAPININGSNSQISVVMQNTSAGGFSSVVTANDLTSEIDNVVWGSTATGTRFGLAKANLASTLSAGAAALAVGTATSAPLVFGTNDVERARFNSSGILGIGTTVPSTRLGQKFDVAASANYGGGVLSTWSTSLTETSILDFTKSASATIGTQAIVANDENLGAIVWRGSDGSAMVNAASIQGFVSGTPNSGVMPGVLTFSTTPSGSGSVLERMRISPAGNIGIGTTSPTAQLHTTSTVRFAGLSGVGTSGCLGNDTSGNITAGNPCTGTGFPSGGVKGDIAYYSAASTGAATKASDANIVIQGGDPSGAATSTAAAVAAYGYSKRIVLPPAPGGATGVYKFSTNVTFPTGTELHVPCGVTLSPDATVFVRNMGTTKAEQCVIVAGSGTVYLGRDVKADWWPSTGGDDTLAINAADKSTNNAAMASFTASIAGTTMTVTAVANGYLTLGKPFTGSGVTAGTYITAYGSGTGENGTYTISASQTVSSTTMTGDLADGTESIIRLSCRTYTAATAIIFHANSANSQTVKGCGTSTIISASGGSFSRGVVTQAGMTAGVGNDLMAFTWQDFAIQCSANQNVQGATIGTTTNATRSYTKNKFERIRISDCRVGLGLYNTRLLNIINPWINVPGETTSTNIGILMDFDDSNQFVGDSDIEGGQIVCQNGSVAAGAAYGLRMKSNGTGTNISGIRVHGTVFYYCNKMVYAEWASTGTMGDHWFTGGVQCETCGNIADYAGSTGTRKAAMLRFDDIYVTGLLNGGQPYFRFAGGNADEIVDILIHGVRVRAGGGCSSCRFASLEFTALATLTDNQLANFEGTGSNPNEIINLFTARKTNISNNVVDPNGISGAVPYLAKSDGSTNDVVIVGNNARSAVSNLFNISSGSANRCVAQNLPSTAIDC